MSAIKWQLKYMKRATCQRIRIKNIANTIYLFSVEVRLHAAHFLPLSLYGSSPYVTNFSKFKST